MRALLLLLLSPAALAQPTGTIFGRVVDDLGDPLPGANIAVDGTGLGAATDINGNYFVIDIPVGEYDITAAFVGYQLHTKTAQVVAEHTQRLDFELGTMEFVCGVETVTEPECDDPNIWRPYISRDPFASRVVSGQQIECLAIER